jgi:hypothetical protein
MDNGGCDVNATCVSTGPGTSTCGCNPGYSGDGTSCTPLDGGAGDAGPADAGMVDAGPPDSGPADGGPGDAGLPDAGLQDGGTPDAGAPDAGPPDAGPADAGLPDAGTSDAGTSDGGCEMPVCGVCPGDSPPAYNWTQWPLPSDAPPDSEYSASADGQTVTDSVTGLTWQRNVSSQTYTWQDAQAYCTALNIGPQPSCWRLPTRIELQSIVLYGPTNPTIDLQAFPGTVSDWYWSASPYVSRSGYAWIVAFNGGATDQALQTMGNHVRCVQ